MQRFQLPLLSSDTALDGALATMRDRAVWGAVVASGPGHRLLHLDDLGAAYRERYSGETNYDTEDLLLNEVSSFSPLLLGEPTLDDTMVSTRLRQVGARYMFLGSSPDTAFIASASELYAAPFLSGPPYKICTRPFRPHYYPPLPPPPDQMCRVCGYQLV